MLRMYRHDMKSGYLAHVAFAVLGVCTCIFGAGGSVSMNLQHGEPSSGCKNLGKK